MSSCVVAGGSTEIVSRVAGPMLTNANPFRLNSTGDFLLDSVRKIPNKIGISRNNFLVPIYSDLHAALLRPLPDCQPGFSVICARGIHTGEDLFSRVGENNKIGERGSINALSGTAVLL